MQVSNKIARKLKKKFRRGISLKRLTISIALSFALLISLFFSGFLTNLLRLYPNTSFLNGTEFEIHFVDVGQGDATLIKLPDGKTMMVDFAPESSYPKLNKYLDKVFFNGIERKLDYIVLTHSDADHIGGMENILNNYAVDNVYYSLDLEDNNKSMYSKISYLENENKIVAKINTAGNEIRGENYLITWLSPNRESYVETNDYSPIMLFEFNDFSFMLTGDARSEVGEKEAMNYFLEDKDIDLLKLGHHGSSTSTSLRFLETFMPEIAVISNGTTYGHPSSETIETLATYDNLYAKNTADYFSTLDKGNIIVTNNGINFIENVFDYIFVPYYLIVIAVVVVLMINALIPRRIHREEWIKMRARRLKRLKKKKIDKTDILGTI